MVFSIFILVALLGIASLAVDYGRVRLANAQLQDAVDAAARYGATALPISIGAVHQRVQQAAGQNLVDGQPLQINPAQDIEFGVWDPETRTFEVLTGSARNGATAIRVTGRRSQTTGNPIPGLFSPFIGRQFTNIQATAVVTRGQIFTPVVNADACPWLAGMPNGSRVKAYGGNTTDAVAPAQSPPRITNLPLIAGMHLHFRQTEGTTSYSEQTNWYGPDGQTDWIVRQNPENGIHATRAPINSLVGIFLDDRQPDTWQKQGELDFTTAQSRNFSELRPGLKQVFYIGDGLDSQGRLQTFVVPEGATRFYLAIMDEKGWWWDNVGNIKTTMLDSKITLVK